MIVTETARAKVNLALRVVGRRVDGYHQLDSLVAFADFGDELTFEAAPAMELHIAGRFGKELPADESNLVMRAARALEKRWPEDIVPCRIRLDKRLPVASGIGGGSADAAATIRGLQRFSQALLPFEDVLSEALKLGADVPVCLTQTASRMEGIGEQLTPLGDFRPLPALLVNPGVPVSTARVFQLLGLKSGEFAPQKNAALQPGENDLETSARRISQEIGTVIEALRSRTSTYCAAMSGSGATCFGLFEDMKQAELAEKELSAAFSQWWIARTELR